MKVPELGDTVTWLDARAGTRLSGVVVTARTAGVWCAIDRGGGAIGYTVIWNEDILSVTPPMTRVDELRGSIVAGLDYESDDWDMGQGEEGAATRAHQKKVDDLITAVREEERARLEESYRKGEY